MEHKTLNPMVKFALEFGPVLLFFVAYTRLKENTYTIGGTDYEGFIVVTAAFVPLLLASIGILWKLTGKISRMQVLTAVMVIFFGGLTVWFNDERFFKIKTTIVYGVFASVLGLGLILGKSWLEYVMDELLPLTSEGWMILTKRLTFAFAALAIANEVVWRTMSTDAWVKIETFGFPVALFAFFMLQTGLFQKYSSEEQDET